MPKIIELTDDNFDNSVLKSSLPVLVDFWGDRCVPCRALVSILENISTQYAGRLAIGKLNVEAGRKTATRFGVRSLPTLLFFKDGKPMWQYVGLTSEKELKDNLDSALSG